MVRVAYLDCAISQRRETNADQNISTENVNVRPPVLELRPWNGLTLKATDHIFVWFRFTYMTE